MTEGPQDAVAALVPGAGGLGLRAPSGAVPLPATVLTDQAWIDRRVAATAARFGIEDPRVAATVEWYSASAVALTPVLAGLATGRWLSARLVDTTLYAGHADFGAPLLAAVSSRAGRVGGPAPAETLRELLVEVIGAMARAGRMREQPLWAIATDSIADRLLALGRALGAVPAVTALAGPLAAEVGAPLPAPRYVDVGGARFVRRSSCCLLYRAPHQPLCVSCPRRDPDQRRVLLEEAAAEASRRSTPPHGPGTAPSAATLADEPQAGNDRTVVEKRGSA